MEATEGVERNMEAAAAAAAAAVEATATAEIEEGADVRAGVAPMVELEEP